MPKRDDFDDDLDPSEDAYDYKPISSNSGGGQTIRLFIVVTVLAAVGFGGWYMLGDQDPHSAGLPIVRADIDSIKVRPDDPGGMQVPNRDKTVYDRVSGSEGNKIERLLPEPEQPLEMPRPTLSLPDMQQKAASAEAQGQETQSTPAAPTASSKATAAKPTTPPPAVTFTEEPVGPIAEAPAPVVKTPTTPPPAAPTATADDNAPRALTKRVAPTVKPEQSVVPAQDQKALTDKIAAVLQEETQAKPAPQPKAPSNQADKGYSVQILSSKNQKAVDAARLKLISAQKDLLSAQNTRTVQADLGPEKGIYYRLRVGPYPERNAANQLCSTLKQRQVECFIVHVE